MAGTMTPGSRLRQAINNQQPLPIVNTLNAYYATLAEQTGYKALYLRGSAITDVPFGQHDLGMTNLTELLEDTRRITAATSLPLLVDRDAGWGDKLAIARTVKEMIQAGAAAIPIADQATSTSCGHCSDKTLVSKQELADRIKSAVDARTDATFMIVARTNALTSEGLDGALERAYHCVEAGADAVFAEAMNDLRKYRMFADVVRVPLLTGMTGFGQSPYYTDQQLASAGVRMVLYPFSIMDNAKPSRDS